MTTSTTHGVSPEVYHWEDDANCRNAWDAFDLAHLTRDGVNAALARCWSCPVLDQCRDATAAQKPEPDGFIQAGKVWPQRNGNKAGPAVRTKQCGVCGDTFHATDAKTKYCSSPCSRAASIASTAASTARARARKEGAA